MRYKFSFVEIPRKFTIAKHSIRKLGSLSALIMVYSNVLPFFTLDRPILTLTSLLRAQTITESEQL